MFQTFSARRDNKRYGRANCSSSYLWVIHGPGTDEADHHHVGEDHCVGDHHIGVNDHGEGFDHSCGDDHDDDCWVSYHKMTARGG